MPFCEGLLKFFSVLDAAIFSESYQKRQGQFLRCLRASYALQSNAVNFNIEKRMQSLFSARFMFSVDLKA